MRSRLPLVTCLAVAIFATPFLLTMAGCDGFMGNRPKHVQPTPPADAGGGTSAEGGAPPGPTITAQPGDIQL